MRTTFKLLIVLALALATFSQHSAASAGGNFRFRGDSADASFFSSDGCVETNVFVFASDGINQSPPGPGGTSSWMDLAIFQYDICNEIVLVDAFGSTPLADSAFQVSGKLGSATLDAVVSVYNFANDSSFDVSVDLTWSGFGPTIRQSSRSTFDSPGCKIRSSFRGTFRSADVSGSVTNGTNFTPEPGGGSIASVQQGDLFIGCN